MAEEVARQGGDFVFADNVFAAGGDQERVLIQKTGLGSRCLAVADEGTSAALQCQRLSHPQDPEAHDFAPQSSNAAEAVDGGRNWREWILMVRNARTLLLPERDDDGMTVLGHLGAWTTEYRAAVLASVATALGLTVERNTDGVPVLIKETQQ